MMGQKKKMQHAPENVDNYTNHLQFFFHLVPHLALKPALRTTNLLSSSNGTDYSPHSPFYITGDMQSSFTLTYIFFSAL